MDRFFEGRVCLITGGAQGIGWAITQALAERGAQVYACTLSTSSLERARQELAGSPWADRIHLAQCDVSKRDQLEAWIGTVVRETGRIDVLINNAAFVRWEDVSSMSVEDAELTMQVGYNAMLYSIKTVLPLMQAAGRGHIVNMGSSAGRVFVGGSSAAYSAAKAAVEGYTRTLHIELAGSPIKTTLVRLGTVAGTDFFRKYVPASRLPRIAEILSYLTPPQVGRGVMRAIRTGRPILDMPAYLPFFYMYYNLFPGIFLWLVKISGSGRRNFGELKWDFKSKSRRK
jgi:NAD(P)-dependent dehydrogenase (short-subunit alcohol dehydrogenase family)